MGVRFNREYRDIVDDLGDALRNISDCFTAFDMTSEDWNDMGHDEKNECLRTLADDVFYGLGSEPNLDIGSGKVQYDRSHHLIKVYPTPHVVHLVKLV